MIKRTITADLLDCYREYPVVTILGPRQSGKTTLAKMTFPDKKYFSLEDVDIREVAENDPRGFLKNVPQGCILDEIQRVPSLLSYIQGMVDDPPKECRFVLTGSHQPMLHEAISQSLAGRTAILNLYPFSLKELENYKKKWDPFELCFKGSYPRLHQDRLKPLRYYNGYLQTYIERDVRSIINIQDLSRFQQFLKLLAGRIGQIVNYTSLSNDIGVSSTTIKSWISVLKASFIIYELAPYFRNVKKRVIKSPKLYFTDTGLACRLLGINSTDQAIRDPLRGNLYENLIIMEFVKLLSNNGLVPELYFYRDTHENEIDLLIEHSRKLIPVEIKSASTFTPEFVKTLNTFKDQHTADISEKGYVVYNGAETLTFKGNEIFNPFVHRGLDFCIPE